MVIDTNEGGGRAWLVYRSTNDAHLVTIHYSYYNYAQQHSVTQTHYIMVVTK